MSRVSYYHGGPSGIWPSRILPPSKTGAPSTASFGAGGVCRTDRIYVTTSRDAAIMFAAMAPCARGSVYEVEPEGELQPDPDCNEDGLSYECEAARILREFPLERALVEAVRAQLGAGGDHG